MKKKSSVKRLKDIVVNEVSLVDFPAIEEVFLFTKSLEGGDNRMEEKIKSITQKAQELLGSLTDEDIKKQVESILLDAQEVTKSLDAAREELKKKEEEEKAQEELKKKEEEEKAQKAAEAEDKDKENEKEEECVEEQVKAETLDGLSAKLDKVIELLTKLREEVAKGPCPEEATKYPYPEKKEEEVSKEEQKDTSSVEKAKEPSVETKEATEGSKEDIKEGFTNLLKAIGELKATFESTAKNSAQVKEVLESVRKSSEIIQQSEVEKSKDPSTKLREVLKGIVKD